MAVRKFKPTTPGQRHKIIGTFEEITASVPEKSLVYGKKSSGGRNNEGKMTMRYLGGGHRKVIRTVRLVSHCYFMLMVKKDILLLPMDCKLVRL